MNLDTENLVPVINSFYEAAVNPDIWPEALGRLSSVFEGRGALLTTPVFIPGQLVHSRSLNDSVDQFFSERWYERDVRTVSVRPTHWQNGVFSDHTLFSEQEMSKSEYYEKFANKAGVPFFAAGSLQGEITGDCAAVSLQRSASQGAFQPEEMIALKRLLPQLRPAVGLATRIATLNGRSMIDGLQLASQASILVNTEGTVLYMNGAADRLLGDRIFIKRGQLEARDRQENRALASLLAYVCDLAKGYSRQEAPPLRVVINPADKGRKMLITAAPIRRSGADLFGLRGAIVMLADLSQGRSIPAVILQQLFDLTKREADIMSLLGDGQDVLHIIEILGISRETIRTHLKAIFAKTGARRQSEVVALHARISGIAGE